MASFELVETDLSHFGQVIRVKRMEVPGGWLYLTTVSYNHGEPLMSTSFVPKPVEPPQYKDPTPPPPPADPIAYG